jgi:hypothetical protein
MNGDERLKNLEQALRDERAERVTAQYRSAEMSQHSTVWRKRAEDRAARIEKLTTDRERLVADRKRLVARIDKVVAERDDLRTVKGWLRSKPWRSREAPETPSDDGVTESANPDPTPPIALGDDEPATEPTTWIGSPRFLSVRVVMVGVEDPIMLRLLHEFNAVDIADEPTLLYRAEFVVVGDGGLDRVSDEAAEAFVAWEASDLRKPLLWLGSKADGLAVEDAPQTLSVDRQWAADGGGPVGDIEIATTFDEKTWSPAATVVRADVAATPGADRSRIHELDGSVWILGHADLAVPWMLNAAAAGVPFVSDEADVGTIDTAKRAAALRRLAFAKRSPWIIAADLLDRLGLGHRPALPRVTGVLLSNRPEIVVTAIAAFGQQSYPNLELVVGCHGFDSESVRAALSDLPHTTRVKAIEFPSSQSLGLCLNAAIEAASGAVIAKIDDDDHYGSGYITDAVQAMFYSGSPLVGKRAAFTYLESENTTYLRRPDIAERFFNGFPIGATLVFERGLWERVGFPDRTVGEDSALTAAAQKLGLDPYSSSPWEFVYRRSVEGNTWSAADVIFTEGSVVAWEGDDPIRADLGTA